MNNQLLLIWTSAGLCFFSLNLFSAETKNFAQSCSEMSAEISKKARVLKAGLTSVNESIVALELATLGRESCSGNLIGTDSKNEKCNLLDAEYQQLLNEYEGLVVSNELQQEEFFLQMKEYGYKHCPLK